MESLLRDLKSGRRPLTLLLLLLTVVVLLSWCVQAVIWLVGWDYSVFSQRGRWIMIVLALGGICGMMAQDRRPLADFGIVFGQNWKRVFLTGLGAGLVSLTVYYLVALAAGFAALNPEIRFLRLLEALGQGVLGLVVSPATNLIFCGYLLSTIRKRHSRLLSVGIVALLFGFMHHPEQPLVMLTTERLPMFVGMSLAMALLGILRLHSGSILLGSGLLAGWLFVERLLEMGRVLYRIAPLDHKVAAWMFSNHFDAKQGPLLWTAMGTAILMGLLSLHRWGDKPPPAPADQVTPLSLKRLYPLMQTNLFAPLDVWMAQLWRVGFKIDGSYLPRLIFALMFSTVNTLLCLPERLLMPLLLRSRSVKNPIFILGVHRSGTTHLHNLLSLDTALVTPRMYQVMNPGGFLFTGWPILPLMACMPPRRPMDNMSMHLFAPAEEEYAMANSTYLSPYWSQAFPKQIRYYEQMIFPNRMTPKERRKWRKHYLRFLKKLTFFSNRRPLLKSPYNTARVALLHALFPRAKFIHLHRHPHDVYRSNGRLAEHFFVLTHLQEPDSKSDYVTRFPANYRRIETLFYKDTREFPREQVIEVAFADLEKDPLGQIARIYKQLNLDYCDTFQKRLQGYLDKVGDYQKNRSEPPDPALIHLLNTELQPIMERGGYSIEES